MKSSNLSLLFLVCLGLACVVGSNPITSLFGKSDGEKAEGEDRIADATTTSTTTSKSVETTTTTTSSPNTACGGLKGFLHICDKEEPTETKNIKTRSAPEEDSSSEENDSDVDSAETVKEEVKEAPSNNTESKTGVIEKRQVENTEEPLLASEPLFPPEVPANLNLKKRQADEPENEDKDDEKEENSRRRRDCRDREDDYDKDCRKKRELVPPAEPKPSKNKLTEEKPEKD